MKRVLAIVTHNWPLKVAAIGLAVLLYIALALSQNSKDYPGRIPIDVRNQPSNALVLGGVQYVTSVRYFAPADVASRVSGDEFKAYVDLSSSAAVPDAAGDVTLDVTVTATDPLVTILDVTPRRITVHLDPLRSKEVPVQVDHGTPPAGLDVRAPILDITQVTVSGTQSTVSQVVAAVARVRIDPSGIQIDQEVDLVAVDARNQVVTQVHLDPSSVRVKILVGTQLQNRSLPVNPVVTGTPASGFELSAVEVDPLVVSLEGNADTLAALTKIDTEPLSVTGASTDVSQTVGLVLPAGVEVLGNASIRIVAHIDAMTATRTFSVGPVLSGAHDDRTYALSTDQVLVTLGGSAAALAGIQGSALVVTADVDALGPGTHDVVLKANLPAGITLVAVSPAKVTVTVGAIATPTPPPTPSPGLSGSPVP
ncbi:MAG TPA: CdaR family protein [Candidatus Acidoferrum sp.]|nr:CdaR family protein [Candidatus Acidoferrum sp.]